MGIISFDKPCDRPPQVKSVYRRRSTHKRQRGHIALLKNNAGDGGGCWAELGVQVRKRDE